MIARLEGRFFAKAGASYGLFARVAGAHVVVNSPEFFGLAVVEFDVDALAFRSAQSGTVLECLRFAGRHFDFVNFGARSARRRREYGHAVKVEDRSRFGVSLNRGDSQARWAAIGYILCKLAERTGEDLFQKELPMNAMNVSGCVCLRSIVKWPAPRPSSYAQSSPPARRCDHHGGVWGHCRLLGAVGH